jgi:UDP-N-acetylbacillosamine N-acetyltransferase
VKDLLILGAGGHGRVVADTAQQIEQWNSIKFLDDAYPELMCVNDYAVIGEIKDLERFLHDDVVVFIAVGENVKRLELINQCLKLGADITTLVHPQAIVSDLARVAKGTLILAAAVVNANALIDQGCIINTGAVVEHDCILAKGVHIAPNATLTGGVKVGEISFVGAASVIVQNTFIANNVFIGAGSVVIKDVNANQKIAGNPAREI